MNADRLRAAAAEIAAEAAHTRVMRAAFRLRMALKYNPNWPSQPRVPAGKPDGGQWTDGGSELLPEISWSTETIDALVLAGDVTGFRKHGINQAINRRVGPAAILDAIRNPVRILPQSNGTVRYMGRDAVVVLNPAGEVVTVWGQ